jgi:hypothetical protein
MGRRIFGEFGCLEFSTGDGAFFTDLFFFAGSRLTMSPGSSLSILRRRSGRVSGV